ncbi:uncharacterized protein LACBIDRAFT_308881 [Laccaria bicolor S238N-H82]|uniref:DNA-directed RNA polymerase III subunit RPC9 n=1 Tax=Laccaria bicolor (strain S238N-H82 / ATCC MYA-4686) TaxID=486041 RepID=B0CUZ7_LACBS|nr:uncharacterized protein LACBIDRAFT_308881 [Laccaria bicolor S238N-H82]EDR13244.1 predicted protein [Laccaria bicolor S238N-H82]|eukprot:XP_001875742.1 predicted protein [Laccaria bicolor S238N-H82]
MEVVNPRVALLSNLEVLTLLRELESDHLTRTKLAQRIKKEEEASGTVHGSSTLANINAHLEATENLRTIEVEAIGYLSADYLPTSSQSAEGVTKLVKDLAPYELTKAEKLQVVNLAPTLAVELYVIVEELEDRLGDRMEEILTHVRSSTATAAASASQSIGMGSVDDVVHIEEDSWQHNSGEDADGIIDEDMFDDTGEGAGVEGDLDVDDDD